MRWAGEEEEEGGKWGMEEEWRKEECGAEQQRANSTKHALGRELELACALPSASEARSLWQCATGIGRLRRPGAHSLQEGFHIRSENDGCRERVDEDDRLADSLPRGGEAAAEARLYKRQWQTPELDHVLCAAAISSELLPQAQKDIVKAMISHLTPALQPSGGISFAQWARRASIAKLSPIAIETACAGKLKAP